MLYEWFSGVAHSKIKMVALVVALTSQTYCRPNRGFDQLRLSPTQKIHHENKTKPERCMIWLFELFLSKRTQDTERYYLQAKTKYSNDLWYTNRPIGHNKLKTFMKKMAGNAGLKGRKTNIAS